MNEEQFKRADQIRGALRHLSTLLSQAKNDKFFIRFAVGEQPVAMPGDIEKDIKEYIVQSIEQRSEALTKEFEAL